LSLSDTVEWTVDWYWSSLRDDSADHRAKTVSQIDRYEQIDKEAPTMDQRAQPGSLVDPVTLV